MLNNFLQGLFTGKLAWLKVALGLLAGILISLSDLVPLVGINTKWAGYIGAAVGVGTWLSTHGFHKAEPPQPKLGN